jgi:NADH dehydrogenase (ubiquinone) 1 alpha subcomplex subunit 6
MQVCRWVPWTIKNYKLDELTNGNALRSNLSFMFKQYSHITNPRVVDVLIYKGREELEVSLSLQLYLASNSAPMPYR